MQRWIYNKTWYLFTSSIRGFAAKDFIWCALGFFWRGGGKKKTNPPKI